jgi:hypothetical protein
MITLIYLIKPEEIIAEKTWLSTLQVYPVMQPFYNLSQNTKHIKVGVIVSPDVALTIKLRHPLQFQAEYRQ